MKHWLKILLLCSTVLLVSACHDKNVLRVGTISGPETQLMETAKEVAKANYGLDVKIIEFTDYVQPNAALNDGSIEANMFQHQPYLDQQIKNRHFKLVAVGKTFIYPMGVYSKKFKAIADIPAGAIISIPNDPSNEGRALLLLEKAGLIKLKNTSGLYSTPVDIIDNPKHLKFKELAAAHLTRSLADVDLAVINTNYAIPAGLSPTKDALYHEDTNSPYANIIVVREDEVNDPRIKQLVAAIQSEAVAKAAEAIFNGQAIPAWTQNS
jgi:D-methionine transport system substrate-binding protein